MRVRGSKTSEKLTRIENGHERATSLGRVLAADRYVVHKLRRYNVSEYTDFSSSQLPGRDAHVHHSPLVNSSHISLRLRSRSTVNSSNIPGPSAICTHCCADHAHSVYYPISLQSVYLPRPFLSAVSCVSHSQGSRYVSTRV